MNLLTIASPSLGDPHPLAFLDMSAAAGFDGVGLRLNPSPNRHSTPVVGDTVLIRQIKQKLKELNLVVLDFYSFFMVPEFDFDQYTAALELGAELGAKYCVTMGNDPEWNRMGDNFGRLCDAAAQFGLTATIEFAPQLVLGTLQDTVRFLEASGRDNVSIMVDPYHFVRGGGTVEALRQVDTKYFPYGQLSDATPAKNGTEWDRALLGLGTLPLNEMMDIFPYDMPLSLECISPDPSIPVAVWAQQVADTARQFLVQYHRTRAV